MILENGEQHDGDILIGADGIWSEVNYTTLFFQFCFEVRSLVFLAFSIQSILFCFLRFVQNSLGAKKQITQVSHAIVD